MRIRIRTRLISTRIRNPGNFQGLSQLKKLDLSGNLIRHLPDGLLDGLGRMELLRFRKNALASISEHVFKDLVKLTRLHLQQNLLTTIHSRALVFMTELEELLLHENSLTYEAGSRNRFLSAHTFEKLRIINLSSNFISAIEENLVITCLNLEVLDLSNNSFTQFSLEQFSNLINYGHLNVNLSANQIKRVDMRPTTTLAFSFKDKTDKFTLDLSGNPLICDCFITELKKKAEGNLNPNISKAFSLDNIDNLRCGQEYTPRLSLRRLREVPYDDLNCNFPSDELPKACPDRCGCAWNRANHRIKVGSYF